MKIKIKAAVVLNQRETHILAGILARNLSKGTASALDEDQRAEEKQMMQEFIDKREELNKRLRN